MDSIKALARGLVRLYRRKAELKIALDYIILIERAICSLLHNTD